MTTFDVEGFACSCGEERMGACEKALQDVADELCHGDVALIATGVVYGLQRYSASITWIPSDMWAAIEARTDDGTFKVRMKCDRIEHGLALLYLTFKDHFPEGSYVPSCDDDEEDDEEEDGPSDEDLLLAATRESNQLTEAAQSVINENLALRAERDRLQAAHSLLLRAAEELRPFADEFRFPSGRVDSRVAEVCRGVIAALDGSPVMGVVKPPPPGQDAWIWTCACGTQTALTRCSVCGWTRPMPPIADQVSGCCSDCGNPDRYCDCPDAKRVTCRWCHEPIIFLSSSELGDAEDAWVHEGPQLGHGPPRQRACEPDMQSMLAEPDGPPMTAGELSRWSAEQAGDVYQPENRTPDA